MSRSVTIRLFREGSVICFLVFAILIHWCFPQDVVNAPRRPALIPKITISKETTWATAPLDERGFVDYFAVINSRFSAGVTPENNAVVLLYRALGPRPDGTRQPEDFFRLLGMPVPPDDGKYYSPPREGWPDRTLNEPWKESDYPWLVAWFRSQAEPLNAIVEASERSESFSPLVNGPDAPLMAVLLPGIQRSRDCGRALVARAMWKLGEGSRFDAWRDLMAAHRLGRLVGRGPTGIEGLVGVAIEQQAMAGELRLIAETQPPAKQVTLFLRQLQRLPPRGPFVEKIDICERAIYLDSCIRLARRQLTFEEVAGVPAFEHVAMRPFVEEALIRDIDWDEVLRSLNRSFDDLTDALRAPSAKGRDATLFLFDFRMVLLAKARKQEHSWLVILADQSARTRYTADFLASRFLPNVQNLVKFEDRTIQKTRNLEIALALSAWRGDHESYPKSLGELAPKYLESVPLDFFTGQPLRYERRADGYRFYSFGPNGIDDEGQGEDDKPSGDDLAVQMTLELRIEKP